MSLDSGPIRFPAAFDYGSRKGFPTRAVVFHMAEGTNVAQFLAGKPARGVSVHYTVEQRTSRWKDGQIVRCLPEGRISGSINPDTIRTTNDPNGFYGVKHNRFALGDLWRNPNVAVISVEVAGRAAQGPTDAQVRSMVQLFEDVDSRYGRVIPLGHRDFQAVKACPGQTAAIRLAFAQMGGHGTAHDPKGGRYVSTRGYLPGRICDIADGAALLDTPGGKKIGNASGELTRDLLGWSPNGRDFALVSTDMGQRTAWVKAGQVANVRAKDPGDPDGNAANAAWTKAHEQSIEYHQQRIEAGP